MKKNVFVSSCGTGNGYATVALKTFFPEFNVVGADINPSNFNASSLYCDEYIQSIEVASDKYTDYLEQVLSTCKPDFFFGFIESDLVKARPVCARLGINFCGPEEPEIFIDKLNYLKLLSDVGILVPKIYSELEPPKVGEKVISKPRSGFGSKGLKVYEFDGSVATKDQVLMEFIQGAEYTVDCFFDKGRKVFESVVRERVEVKSGVCTKARVFRSEEIQTYCEIIASNIGLRGTFCVQFIQNDSGLYLIDVNPRPGAGTSMSMAMGVNFFAANIAYFTGESYEAHLSGNSRDSRSAKEYNVVRVYTDVCL